MCKCTPRTRSASSTQSKSQFLGHFLLDGLYLEVYLDRILNATTRKGRQLFDGKKCTPDKILAVTSQRGDRQGEERGRQDR